MDHSMGSRPNPLRPRSIRGQLVVLISALAIPLVALQAWWGYRQYRAAELDSDSQALILADATATSIRQFLGLSEEVLGRMAAEHGAEWLAGTECAEPVRGVVDHFPFFVNAIAIRADGTIRCSARPTPAGTTASAWQWLPELRRSGRFTIGTPLLGTISDTWILPLAMPILAPDGSVAGAIVGSMPLLEFSPFLEGVQLDEDQLVTVATAERIVIARSHDAERWVGERLPALVGSSREMAPGRSIALGPDFEGVERTWGQVEMRSGWIVYVGVPTETVFGPARVEATRRMGVTLLILLAGGLLAGAAYRRIARALSELAAGTGLSGEGEPGSFPEATPDEVKAVVEQFNRSLRSRNEAEAAERAARERYQSIFENAVFGLYASTLDGRFLEVNAALASMLGYESTTALVEAGPTALYPSNRVRDELMAAAVESGKIENWEIDWLRADGVPITVRLNGRTIGDRDGASAFEMVVQNITEEKRTEGELRQSQKMEAIGKLAGGIAHDFNNLLTVIGGNLELIEESLTPGHPFEADVEQIREATLRASALTAQLLAFARRDPRGERPVDVNAILTDMDRLLVRLIGEDVALETRLEPGIPAIRIDPGELEQIVMNVVLNARDAMPMGGRVIIETRRAPIDVGSGSEQRNRDGVLLTVRDTGIGMDRETSKRIFEPFYTTKPMGEGTGLGLSTVYGIVQRADGHVSVESEPGYGTTLDAWLPAAEAAAARPAAAVERSAPAGGDERILVVEDEELVRVFVRRALAEAGYDIVTASDGQEALEVLETLEEPIDLVLTDVVMPRMNGTDLAERLAMLSPATPVLYMSGYIQNQSLGGWLRDDPQILLRKPFTTNELCGRVRGALDRRYAEQHG